ncbi:MAG TPA: hypothetical protein VK487_00740 [Candidatus Bathyarchaeia archaeon]|nr:hypothetical protein [Candidatus Bathyarchaeia archaeon]
MSAHSWANNKDERTLLSRSKPKWQRKPRQEHEEDFSVEDSEGDGLMVFDDPMFPPDEDD